MRGINEYINRYVAMNFNIIPIKPNTKEPCVPWKEFQTRRLTWEEIKQFFPKNQERNVAIVTGYISGITVIDVDSVDETTLLDDEKETRRRIVHIIERTNTLKVKTPRQGMHAYFMYSNKIKTGPLGRIGIDIKNDGGYILAPPSRTERGSYEFIEESGKISEMPEELVNLIDAFKKTNIGTTLQTHQDRLAIPQGMRNNYLTSIAGSLRRRGIEYAEIVETLKIINSVYCTPPLPDREVETIARSICRYAPSVFPTVSEVTSEIASEVASEVDEVYDETAEEIEIIEMPEVEIPEIETLEIEIPEGGISDETEILSEEVGISEDQQTLDTDTQENSPQQENSQQENSQQNGTQEQEKKDQEITAKDIAKKIIEAYDHLTICNAPIEETGYEIVEKLFYAGTIGVIAGMGGTGKSTLLYQLSVCVAYGLPFLGFRTRKCNVLYIDAEEKPYFYVPRIKKIKEKLQIQESAEPGTTGKYVHLFLKEVGREYGIIDYNFFVPSLVKQIEVTKWGELFAVVCSELQPGLIIIDPFSYFTSNENDNSSICKIYNLLQLVAPNSCIVIAHHLSKAAINTKTNTRTRTRGAGSMVENSKTHIIMETDTLYVDKCNYARDMQGAILNLKYDGIFHLDTIVYPPSSSGDPF